MPSTKKKNAPKFSKEEMEKIFFQFLDEFVIEKSKKEDREKEVLLEKIKHYTKGKDIVLENTSI